MRGGCRGGGLFLRSDGRARRGDGAFVKMVTDYAFKKKSQWAMVRAPLNTDQVVSVLQGVNAVGSDPPVRATSGRFPENPLRPYYHIVANKNVRSDSGFRRGKVVSRPV